MPLLRTKVCGLGFSSGGGTVGATVNNVKYRMTAEITIESTLTVATAKRYLEIKGVIKLLIT